MNREWDLSILYSSFDDPAFAEDRKRLDGAIGAISALADAAEGMAHVELLEAYIKTSEAITFYASKLIIFANLRYSANTRDGEAASCLDTLMGVLSQTAAPMARLSKVIASYEDLDGAIALSPLLTEHRYLLSNIRRDEKYLLSEGEETLFAKMNISGAKAWEDLQSSLTSSLAVDYNGGQLPLSAIRNLAYDKDSAIRKAAYEAELKAYPRIRDAVAFSLNSIKLQVLSECELRGYASPLDKALYGARMKRETLDALLSAMEEYMPIFRTYLRAKAKALGHEGGLPWCDLFAPMGKTDRRFTVEGARDYLVGIFEGFDTELAVMVKTAFDEGWIDFFPRDGKVGGAFDCGVPSAGQSRVLTNFDGTHSDVVTLAHELGHSFHDRQVFKNSPLNQEYSMPVAETASTFNEVLVMSRALEAAEGADERLALLEGEISDACQIICDIYSRYLFESSVIENRKTEFMDAERLCALMTEAQKKAYGNGLDESCMHPYMWLCKGHYYSGSLSFYNFPYAFGGLFARGLYAKYKKEGAAFVETYKRMLRETALADVEDAARVAGIDLTQREFWCDGLESIAEKIREFCRLVEA